MAACGARGIEPHQQLVARHLFALFHQDFLDAAGDFRRQRHLAFIGERARGEHGRSQRMRGDALEVDGLVGVAARELQHDRVSR